MDIKTFIYEQPQVIETVLQAVSTGLPRIEPADSIYLVGSGTSLNALTAVHPLLSRLASSRIYISGPLAFMAGVSQKPGLNCCAVILSQSGASRTTIAAVEYARRCGMRTLTLTAESDRPIAKISDEKLIIPLGPENVGPKTKGYTASVLVLLSLALAINGQKVQAPRLSAEISRLIAACDPIVGRMAEAHAGADFIMALGQERHLATALEGSLKISEMSGIAAAAFDTEESFHGRFHGLSPSSLALFVTASEDQYEMALTAADVLSELGIAARIFNLGPAASSAYDVDLPWPSTGTLPELDLVGAIVPFQLLAWHLAKLRGLMAEKMKYPGLSLKLKIKTSGVE